HEDLVGVGAQLLGIYQTWNWERPQLDPVLKLGWVVTAKMGAALKRRPYIWVTGPRGCGKSFLQSLTRSLMHGALFASSNLTPAAVYQRLGKDCIPCCLDEQEAKEDSRTTDRLLEIMRAAYSGDALDRGDKDGKSKSYALKSSFMASSINKPAMETSDDSRMALLTLRKLETVPDDSPFSEEEAYRMGQMLSQRAIDWFPRWDTLLHIIEAAMKTRKGHEARSLDTFAPFLAGFHVAMYDDLPTDAQLNDYAELVDPIGLIELRSQVEDWEKCMVHLLGKPVEHLKHSKIKTVGQILARYVKSNGTAPDEADEALAGFRLCLSFKKGDPATLDHALLFVPNTDPLMTDLFGGTTWAGRNGGSGVWNGVLRQAPRHLWFEHHTSKGGFGPQRGVAFRVKALAEHLARDSDGPPEFMPPAPMAPKPSPFDDLEAFR
ncbi:MAG: hypothetical protein H7X95_13355, partial [Deltaproteobacteria bacterium]|nr:hypothetical protein [Deltaproteobacteria bacterium]